jgi:hypothetical protein
MIYIQKMGSDDYRAGSWVSEEYTDVRVGGYLVRHSAAYQTKRKGNSLQLLYAQASVGDQRLCLEQVTFGQAFDMLEQAVGPFIYIEISDLGITVGNSLCRFQDLFFAKIHGEYVVASEMESLLRAAQNPPHINRRFCIDYLCGNETYGGDTVFQGIEHVVLGGFYTFTKKGVSKGFLNPERTLTSDQNLARLVAKNAIGVSRGLSPKYLHFSGGLDSSLIYASLEAANEDFIPLHLMPNKNEDNSEATIAESFCKLYGRPLIKISTNDDVTLAISDFKVYNFVSDVPFFSHIRTESPYQEGCAFSGLGGDAVFMQNPPLLVGVKDFRRLRFLPALRRLLDLATLKRINFFKLLIVNLLAAAGYPVNGANEGGKPKWLRRTPKGRTLRKHPLLSGYSRSEAKYHHMRTVLSNLHLVRQVAVNNVFEFAPLLFQNIVALAKLEPCEESFDGSIDRIKVRAQLNSLKNTPICERIQKKPSSDLYFNVLNGSAEIFEKTLLNSRLVKFLNINFVQLKECIHSNTNITIDDNLQHLERLYKLDIYLRIVPEVCFEEKRT